MTTDQTNNPIMPNHYHKGGVDVIAFITPKISKEEMQGFYRVNALKYLTRAGNKEGEPITQDLGKALYYLDRWKELIENGDDEK